MHNLGLAAAGTAVGIVAVHVVDTASDPGNTEHSADTAEHSADTASDSGNTEYFHGTDCTRSAGIAPQFVGTPLAAPERVSLVLQ